MKVMGIDQSLTSTGVCVLDVDLTSRDYTVVHASCIHTAPTGLGGPQDTVNRARQIANAIDSIILDKGVHYVAMEGLSYASGGKATRSLAMLFGILLDRIKVPTVVVYTPSEIKKHATGKGTASKSEMLKAIEPIKPIYYQQLIETPASKGKFDMSDAFWIAHKHMESH